MGADDDIHLTAAVDGQRLVRQRVCDLRTLLLRGRSGEQLRADAQSGKQRRQIGMVLCGQNLRRDQKRGSVSVFHRQIRACRRHDRFPAAHVADEDPVHAVLSGHVRRDLRDGTGLRAGQRIGQKRRQRCGIGVRHDAWIRLCFSGTALRHTEKLEEQLLKDQPPFCPLKVRHILRTMERVDHIGPCRERHPLQNLRRQGFRDLRPAEPQRLARHLVHLLLPDPAGQRIHRNDGRQRLILRKRLVDRIGGLHFPVRRTVIFAEKPIRRADVERFPHVGHIEVGDLQRPRFVEHAEFRQAHAPPDHTELRFGRDGGKNGGRPSLLQIA